MQCLLWDAVYFPLKNDLLLLGKVTGGSLHTTDTILLIATHNIEPPEIIFGFVWKQIAVMFTITFIYFNFLKYDTS